METRLTQKQETFCVEYFEKGSVTDAALAAGYSRKNARKTGSHNLEKPHVKARIQELRDEVKNAAVMNVQERMEILTELARARMIDFVEVGQDGAWFSIDKTNLNNRAIQSVQSKTVLGKDGAGDAVFIRVNLHDPTKSIDLLNKMDKLYSDGAVVNIDNRKVVFIIGKGYKEIEGNADNRLALRTDKQDSG